MPKSTWWKGIVAAMALAGILAGCGNPASSGQEETTFGWSTGYPRMGTVDETSAEVMLATNADAKAYYVVLPSSDAAPGSEQVVAGQDADGQAAAIAGTANVYADITRTVTVSGLTEEMGYTVYVLAQSTEDTEATTLKALEFTTGAYSYPIDSDTVAMWILSDDSAEDGEALSTTEDTLVFQDLTGNGNDLYLTSYINTGYSKSDLPALEYSSDTYYDHPKNKTSVLFLGKRSYGGYCFRVDEDGPLNSTTFEDTGYTFEAIVKIPSTFTSDTCRWMGIMSLTYPRNSADTAFYYTSGDPPFGWTISNLLEVQSYSDTYSTSSAVFGSAVTNWSSALTTDTWHHIVIVETPGDDIDNRVLYIDGVASTRLSGKNTNGICAMADLYKMWYLVGGNTSISGSNYVNGRIFNGKIDAIRITKGVLPQDEWLATKEE